MSKTTIIGVTGGIACGKSLVVNQFKKIGATIIDADKIAHQILDNPEIKQKLVRAFGSVILDKQKKIKRKKLGEIVFAKKEKVRRLNQITHPAIIREMRNEIKRGISSKNKSKLIVLDAPLLFEARISHMVDKAIVVFANTETQIKRLVKRDGLTIQQAKQRIASQMPLSQKVKLADIVIDNSGSRTRTITEIKKIIKNT